MRKSLNILPDFLPTLFIVLFSSIYSPLNIYPQELIWKHTGGPMGGIIGDMAINSQGEIYAGVYSFMGTSFQFKYYSGLYKSTDYGNSWNEIVTQFDPFEIYALYITKEGDILVGTNHQGRIYLSTDNGQTWENNNSGYNTGECWAFGESIDGVLFAGSGEGEVYRSTDNGDSWEFSDNLGALAFATDSNNTIYCGTFLGLYKSTDKGVTWMPNDFLINVELSSILIDTNNNIYCGTGYYSGSSGVHHSTDGGGNWTYLGLAGEAVLSLTLDSEGNLYAGTKYNGLFKTTDMGQRWDQYQKGIEGIEVFRLKINQQNKIFVGSENEGIFRSTDEGKSFKQVGLPISHIQNIDFSPDKNLIFASTPTGVQRYNRTTGIWENNGLRQIEAVSVSPSGDLYAATYTDGVYRSTDNGESWVKMNTVINYRYNFLAATDSFLIDAVFPKFRKSTDRGNSWDTTYIDSDSWSSILFNDNVVYIHGYTNFESKIFYTNDLGQTFIEITIPTYVYGKSGLSINSFDDLFFTSFGIYRSSYPYTNWIKIFTENSICIYTDSNDIVYSAVEDGILRSTNNGENWDYIFNENMPRTFGQDLKIENGNLYIATNSYGLYELQIPTGVEEENEIVKDYRLYQNYPNPFNSVTKIKFSLPQPENVKIIVYDILGEEINTLINEHKQSGSYDVDFHSESLPSGIYFYTLSSGNYTSTKKLILLK